MNDISIDKVDDGLPISVVVPLSSSRKNFFNNFVLPLIEANNPNEIIINDKLGSAPKKRNEGFKKSTQPYVFFCDDDILLPANYLDILYTKLKEYELKSDAIYGFAYTSYDGIVLHPETHPMRGNFSINSFPFNGERLKAGNYISTMSLINREYFPMFDEKLKRFQDWDIFLNMYINKNIHGVFINDTRFYAYYLDSGITTGDRYQQESYERLKNKYKI